MSIRQTVLAEIAEFLAESGYSASYLGKEAVNDRKFVARLRHGNPQIVRVEAVRQYIYAWRAQQRRRKWRK